MSQQNKKSIVGFRPLVALLFAVSLVSVVGCGSKDTASAPTKPGPPTAAQNAQMQRGMDQGQAQHDAFVAQQTAH